MNTILRKFKKNVLVLCSIAILLPHSSYASTSTVIDDSSLNEIASYSYDAFGRRISKTVNGSTTYFLYSDNQLIAELDETGEMVRAYGWDLNDKQSTTPLWQAEVTNGKLDTAEYHTLINDHLGTPQVAVNDEGTVTWKAVSETFGKAIPDTQNQITMNLRFPGQYYDEETGTHYNFYRDYNPVIGRYIQKDPIGLRGGINWYGYAKGRPNFYIDFLGLDVFIVNRKLSAIGNIVGQSASYRANPITHTFTVVTNPDGSIAHTYSWGNDANLHGWNLDQKLDLITAREALDNGWAERVTDIDYDFCVAIAYDHLNQPEYEHSNWLITNNCKTETTNLLNRARAICNQIFSPAPPPYNHNFYDMFNMK